MEVTEQMKALEVGDTIKCHDPQDMIEIDQELIAGGGTRQNLFTRWTATKDIGLRS